MKWILPIVFSLVACQPSAPPEEAPAPPPPETSAAEDAREEDVLEPGRHELGGKTAYAFAPGQTEAEVRAIIDAAVADGHMKITQDEKQKRPSTQTEVEVTVLELEQLKSKAVAKVALMLFGNRLVQIRVTYRDPNPSRAMGPAKDYGPGSIGKQWVGWWLRETQSVIQWSNDGMVYEIFDLASARPFMPDVERMVLMGWIKRYGKALPPWMQERLDALDKKKAGSPGP